MKIEIAYATREDQHRQTLNLSEGTTLAQALSQASHLPPYTAVGIFGNVMSQDHVLRAGDRIELYRPLTQDPKARRLKKVNESR